MVAHSLKITPALGGQFIFLTGFPRVVPDPNPHSRKASFPILTAEVPALVV